MKYHDFSDLNLNDLEMSFKVSCSLLAVAARKSENVTILLIIV